MFVLARTVPESHGQQPNGCNSAGHVQGQWVLQQLQQQQPDELQLEAPEEFPLPEVAAAAAALDLPEHTANDIFMLEEEVEVER